MLDTICTADVDFSGLLLDEPALPAAQLSNRARYEPCTLGPARERQIVTLVVTEFPDSLIASYGFSCYRTRERYTFVTAARFAGRIHARARDEFIKMPRRR